MIITSYSDLYKTDSSLRPYQQKAKREIFESWDEVDNVMFQMPTGTGKTRLFTSIISDINKYSIQRREAVKILIVAHRTELINQIGKHLDGYKVAHSFIAGGKERNLRKPVLVASIQTITNSHNREVAKKLNVQFIIIDEAHHALAASYKKLWEMYPNAKRLGVTATPWRMNHQGFTDLFNKLVMSMPIKDFIKQGHLAPYKYFSLRDDSYIHKTIDGIELDSFGEYKESSMEEKMDIGSIRAQLLNSYLSLAEGKKGIIYAINIAHARHICKEYEEAGYRVVSIDSKTPSAKRDDLVEKFKNNQIDIIVNVDIFSEGFDCPDIEFIQLARPTRSLVKYLQQVGRGLRPTENKQNCVILDNVGMYSRFGLPDARRHWNSHFKGKKIDEEPTRVVSKGTGKSRYVDLSEGTEDMELIQDVNDIVETNPIEGTSAYNDFFPLFGVTLGETTWKQVEDMGFKVKIWEKGPDRHVDIKGVAFWDNEGQGVFNSIYWLRHNNDFPPSWKTKGFSWDSSYEEWMEVFRNLGYKITEKKQPIQKKYSGRTTLSAKFEALSSDGMLSFDLDFDFGYDGYLTSSPKTLYSIFVYYYGLPRKSENAEEKDVTKDVDEKTETPKDSKALEENVEKPFDPMPLLEACNYKDNNSIFWSDDNKHIYESYIQDDAYFIISELMIDKSNKCVHRKRVGKISKDSWMFQEMERMQVENLKSIDHFEANYTVFHYLEVQSDKSIKDKYFDYKGRKIDAPIVVEAKYIKAKNEGPLHDFMDVPVSKATFRVELLRKSSNISVSKTIKGESKLIAIFPLLSDFGRRYYELDSQRIHNYKIHKISNDEYNKLKNFTSGSCEVYCSDFKSFSVRCNKDGKFTLSKYSFIGKLIYEETIAVDKDVDVNSLHNNDIEKLWHVFDSKATSYKYFWFLSILQFYKENKQSTIIPFKNIVAKMIANAWSYVFKDKGEFPQADQIPKYIDVIIDRYMLDESSDKNKVEGQILYYYFEKSHLDRLLSPLLNNVPYRFLSPWIPFTSNEEVVVKSNEKDARCIYSIHEDHITINPLWCDYLLENYNKIESFIEKELNAYLQSHKK